MWTLQAVRPGVKRLQSECRCKASAANGCEPYFWLSWPRTTTGRRSQPVVSAAGPRVSVHRPDQQAGSCSSSCTPRSSSPLQLRYSSCTGHLKMLPIFSSELVLPSSDILSQDESASNELHSASVSRLSCSLGTFWSFRPRGDSGAHGPSEGESTRMGRTYIHRLP